MRRIFVSPTVYMHACMNICGNLKQESTWKMEFCLEHIHIAVIHDFKSFISLPFLFEAVKEN